MERERKHPETHLLNGICAVPAVYGVSVAIFADRMGSGRKERTGTPATTAPFASR
jgi:hypothetical protein